MPYKNLSDLPKSIKDHLPKHAQEIYKEAFNSAYKEYKDPSKRKTSDDLEETAHKVAWSAVKKSYKKGENGSWIKKLAS